MIIHGGHCVLLLTADDGPFSRRRTVSYASSTIPSRPMEKLVVVRSVSRLKLLKKKKKITNKAVSKLKFLICWINNRKSSCSCLLTQTRWNEIKDGTESISYKIKFHKRHKIIITISKKILL